MIAWLVTSTAHSKLNSGSFVDHSMSGASVIYGSRINLSSRLLDKTILANIEFKKGCFYMNLAAFIIQIYRSPALFSISVYDMNCVVSVSNEVYLISRFDALQFGLFQLR